MAAGVGCEIYADRPPSCKGYQCLWLSGDIDLKPSDCGFLIDVDTEKGTGLKMLSALEAWPGALNDEKVMYRLKKLCRFLDRPIAVNGVTLLVPAKLKKAEQIYQLFGTRDLNITWV